MSENQPVLIVACCSALSLGSYVLRNDWEGREGWEGRELQDVGWFEGLGQALSPTKGLGLGKVHVSASGFRPPLTPPPVSVEVFIGTGTGSGFWAMFFLLGGYEY